MAEVSERSTAVAPINDYPALREDRTQHSALGPFEVHGLRAGDVHRPNAAKPITESSPVMVFETGLPPGTTSTVLRSTSST